MDIESENSVEVDVEPAAQPTAPDTDVVEYEIVDDTPPEDKGKKPIKAVEDVSEEELAGYSAKVKKRIDTLSHKFHDERRAKEAVLREREEAVRMAQALLEENKRLKGTSDHSNNLLLDQARRTAAHELEIAKRAYRDAYEAGDPDRVIEAQEKLTDAKIRATKLAEFKLKPQPVVQTQETVVQPQPQQPVARDPKAEQWRARNPWFDTDMEMTGMAYGLHQKLVREGVDPTSDEYYEKIDSRMRQIFPDKFGDEDAEDVPQTSSRARPVVAPATRSPAARKVRLTQSQVAIAKRLGVSLEDYAKQYALEMRKQNG